MEFIGGTNMEIGVICTIKAFARELLNHINNRFPHDIILKACKCLVFKRLPVEKNLTYLVIEQ